MRKDLKIMKLLFLAIAVIAAGITAVSFFHTGSVDGTGVGFAALNMGAFTLDPDYGAVDGDENMGGLSVVGYFCPYSHITAWPTFSESAATNEQATQAIGDFTLAANKYFVKLYGTKYPELNPESQGEHIGGKSFNCKGLFTIMGFKKDARALARIMNNSQGVFIFLNDDGDRIAVGTQYRPATFNLKGKTGKAAADMVGFDIEISADSHIPGYEYNGVIPLDGSTLPAIS